jgi:hypothetical protein
MILTLFLGAWGKMIHEKNLKQKHSLKPLKLTNNVIGAI